MLNTLVKLRRYYFFMLLLLFPLVVKAASSPPISYSDPWEPVNRVIFNFNDKMDTYALKPLAKGYSTVTPSLVKKGVSNFFHNLGDIRNTFSAAFQLKGYDAMTSLTRLVINSTIGIFGFFDIASAMGLQEKYQDFGLALANWGIPSGPYLMLPFFGPKTLRGSIGGFPDAYVSPLYSLKPEGMRWTAIGVKAIDGRAQLLKSDSLVMGDRYSFIRDAYLQNREFQITGKSPNDDF